MAVWGIIKGINGNENVFKFTTLKVFSKVGAFGSAKIGKHQIRVVIELNGKVEGTIVVFLTGGV